MDDLIQQHFVDFWLTGMESELLKAISFEAAPDSASIIWLYNIIEPIWEKAKLG